MVITELARLPFQPIMPNCMAMCRPDSSRDGAAGHFIVETAQGDYHRYRRCLLLIFMVRTLRPRLLIPG